MSTKSGLKTCLKTLLECFALEHNAYKAKLEMCYKPESMPVKFCNIWGKYISLQKHKVAQSTRLEWVDQEPTVILLWK